MHRIYATIERGVEKYIKELAKKQSFIGTPPDISYPVTPTAGIYYLFGNNPVVMRMVIANDAYFLEKGITVIAETLKLEINQAVRLRNSVRKHKELSLATYLWIMRAQYPEVYNALALPLWLDELFKEKLC